MRVAVIVPCFNDGPLVAEAVASARACDEPIELVVIDDGSTDPETLAIFDELERDGVQLIHQENRGLPAARNAGLAATRAPYVFPLDADDLLVGESLPSMADLLDLEPAAAVCFGDYAEFGGPVDLIRAVPASLDPFRVAYANEYPVSALFRRTALEQAGGWKKIGPGYEDWDLWMGLVEAGHTGVHAGVGRLTYRRRLHGERMLTAAKRKHHALYQELKRRHPQLFADIKAHRRRSDMSAARKLLYPVVYGGRRRFAVERHLKALLDRGRIWTLRR